MKRALLAWTLALGLGSGVAVEVMVRGPARADEGGQRFWTDAPSRAAARQGWFAAVADRARPAVVQVRGSIGDAVHPPSVSRNASISVGTGFFVSSDGYVVTNEHVVRGASSLRIRLYDGRELSACVAGWDQPTDIALLKVDPGRPVAALALGDSDQVRVGDPAIVVGNPFGFDHSVTAGIVSARDRVIERGAVRASGNDEVEPYSFFIQTDASINLGNSGGPLLDDRGVVVGVSSAFWGSQQPAQGIGFAIPINVVRLLLPGLKASGEAPRSHLGVDSQAIEPLLGDALGLRSSQGALIAGVEPGSAAEAAGLEPGDLVTSWNGRTLTTVEDFRIFAQLTPPGRKVRLRVLRAGRPLERTVTTRPAAGGAARVAHPMGCGSRAERPNLPLGCEFADVPGAQATRLPGGKGVVVKRVEGGAAREAGLLAGDVILRVGQRTVTSQAELEAVLGGLGGKPAVPLLVRRDGADFWAALPLR